MARTKPCTAACRPGALPRRVRALMAALPSTQEMQEHALPSDTEEESIFPAEEVCAEFTMHTHKQMAHPHLKFRALARRARDVPHPSS